MLTKPVASGVGIAGRGKEASLPRVYTGITALLIPSAQTSSLQTVRE
jgi:hypothetical protein